MPDPVPDPLSPVTLIVTTLGSITAAAPATVPVVCVGEGAGAVFSEIDVVELARLRSNAA